MIVSFNSNTKGYVSVEAHEYRVSMWPTGQDQGDPFVRFQTVEYEQPAYEHIEIETESTNRVVLSILRTVDSWTAWEHHAVTQFLVNGQHVTCSADLAEFDPFQYYNG